MDIFGVRLPEGRPGKVIAAAVISFPVVAAVAVGSYLVYRKLHPNSKTTPETDEEIAARLEQVHRGIPA